jgi:hypothetical protein
MTMTLPRDRAQSQTSRAIEALQLYGYHPNADEPDQRQLPDTEVIEHTVEALFDALTGAMQDTRLEPDLSDILWSVTDLFHRKADRIQRILDENEQRQRQSQDDQDGSEIRDVELQRLVAQGQTILERRTVFEIMRDLAADHFEAKTGSAWRPRAGSMVNHRKMTATLIDSRDFLAAKRIAETEIMLPPGTRILFSGGVEFTDHKLIWDKLDLLHKRYPDMVLIHGGTKRGAEKIAACWADKRKVPQIKFEPDFVNDGKAAPFKRNDRMLETNPVGLVVVKGAGVTDNLADKARKAGIPVNDYRKSGA